jgi:hypothetical protein
MFEAVSGSVNRELMASQVAARLFALGHRFQSDVIFLYGGPQSGVTGQTVYCSGCRKKFKFKRVSGNWQLEKGSTDLSILSCADLRAQNISDRNRLAELIARFPKSSRVVEVYR